MLCLSRDGWQVGFYTVLDEGKLQSAKDESLVS